MSLSIPVLYEDNHCLVLSKPAPLLTQAPPGIPSLEEWAKEYLRSHFGKTGRVYLGIPHRLDRAVTGAVIFARTSKAARRLAEQFQNHQVEKVYLALAEGAMDPKQGEWLDWIVKVENEAKVLCSHTEMPGGKEAKLKYEVLWQHSDHTLVKFMPLTGRMHQIRAQAAAHGCPVLGDMLYGSDQHFGEEAASERERIIALHAWKLTVLHPVRYKSITFSAPVPPLWSQQLDNQMIQDLAEGKRNGNCVS